MGHLENSCESSCTTCPTLLGQRAKDLQQTCPNWFGSIPILAQ